MAESLLSAATATGTDTELYVAKMVGNSWFVPDKHSVSVKMGGDVVATAVTVSLEGSIDKVIWGDLGTHALTAAEITAEEALFHVVDKVVDYIRANLTVLTGGTNPTVTVEYLNQRPKDGG